MVSIFIQSLVLHFFSTHKLRITTILILSDSLAVKLVDVGFESFSFSSQEVKIAGVKSDLDWVGKECPDP